MFNRRAFLLSLGSSVWAIRAQDVPIRATSPLVIVPVSVRDRKGKPMRGLQSADFELTDRGRSVAFRLEEQSTPLSLGVMVQTSRICAPALLKLEKSVSLLGPLIAGWDAEAALWAFDNEVRPLVSFTRNIDKVEEAMLGLRPRNAEGNCLNDTLLMAAEAIGKRRAGRRRVLLVIGESRDRSSKTRLEDAVAALQLSNTTVYWLSFSPAATGLVARNGESIPTPSSAPTAPHYGPNGPILGPPPPPGIDLGGLAREGARKGLPEAARVLTRSTGGFENSFLRAKGLEDAIVHIGEELHGQYILSFRPSAATEPEWRELAVKVKTRRDARLRNRPGYWITPD